MLPGGIWLLTGWGLFSWRIDIIVALGVVGTFATLIAWTLGWLHNRYVLWERPAWLVHPATRAMLVFAFGTFLGAWPFGSSGNPLTELFGILFAPVFGGILAVIWTFAFGLRKK